MLPSFRICPDSLTREDDVAQRAAGKEWTEARRNAAGKKATSSNDLEAAVVKAGNDLGVRVSEVLSEKEKTGRS